MHRRDFAVVLVAAVIDPHDIGLVLAGIAIGMALLWGWAIVAAGPRAWNPPPDEKGEK